MECGACCAAFRVSFHWSETDAAEWNGVRGSVPATLTRQAHAHLSCMAGTDSPAPRCVALEGNVGKAVSCTIYALRPSTCREFNWHDENGQPDERCNTARQRLGLRPLTLADMPRDA